MSFSYDFKDKVVVITGGSRGLGKEMSLAFASCGAKVVIASRKIENCKQLASEINKKGGSAFPVELHAGDWTSCENLVEEVYSKFQKVDVLINNAGMSPLYPSLEEVTEALFEKVVSVNLKGPFRLSAQIGTRMVNGDGGAIINISSTASVSPSPNAEPYGAVKAGLNALTRSLASAFGPKVRVNCIMPGPFLTDISKAWDLESFNKRAKSSLALERGGQPEEIIGAALYFASDLASFTTGCNSSGRWRTKNKTSSQLDGSIF